MEFTFNVFDLEDALLARAALDGLVQKYQQIHGDRAKEAFACECGTDKSGLVEDKPTFTNIAGAIPASLAPAMDKALGAIYEGIDADMAKVPEKTQTSITAVDTFIHTNNPLIQGKNEAPASVEQTAELIPESPAQDSYGVADTDNGSAVYTKEQIKEAAGHNQDLALLMGKKGPKSAATQARIQELTAAFFLSKTVETNRGGEVGETLKGLSAQQLHEMLGTTSSSPPTTQATGTVSQQEIHEMLGTTSPPTTQATGTVSQQEIHEMLGFTPHTENNPLAPTENNPLAPTETAGYDKMTKEELFDALQSAAEQPDRGLFWFKRVADAGGGAYKMSVDHMRAALMNPDTYAG